MKPGLYVATVKGVEGVQVHGPDPDGEFVILSHLADHSLGLFEQCYALPQHVTDARPLVVLDPESVTDVDALAKALVEGLYAGGQHSLATQGIHVDYVRDALRALAAPTPAEPMGLGAVVRFDDGRLASRVEVAHDYPWAIRGQAGNYSWGFLSANNTIEVLSEGWSE